MNYAKYVLAVMVAAWVVAFLSAPVTTVQNLFWLESVGAEVSFGIALTSVIKDIFRFGAVFSLMMMVGLSVGFIIAGLIRLKFPVNRYVTYGLAGGVSVPLFIYLMVELTLGVPLIAGNRSFIGVVLHTLIGVCGGLVYAHIIGVKRLASLAIRVLTCIPLFIIGWTALQWTMDPAATAKDFGLDFAVLSDYGRNTAIRDMSAFFYANVTLMLLGAVTLNYRWFVATSMIFLYAMGFNIVAIEIHGTEMNPALIFEFVIFSWTAALAVGTYTYIRFSYGSAVT